MSPKPEVHELKVRLAAPMSEFSAEFVQAMANRMAVSFHKYGAVADAYPAKVDALASLHDRLDLYERTGNTEWLVDAANFALIEFVHPRHPDAHFRATDSDESPGRVAMHGQTAAPNNALRWTDEPKCPAGHTCHRAWPPPACRDFAVCSAEAAS